MFASRSPCCVKRLLQVIGANDISRPCRSGGYRFSATVLRKERSDLHSDIPERHLAAGRPESPITLLELPLLQTETSEAKFHARRSAYFRIPYVTSSLVLILLCGVAVFHFHGHWTTNHYSAFKTESARVRSVAVLPFTTIGENGEDAYLGLGMSNAVTAKLANLGKVLVRPSSALTKYSADSDPRAAGREQGVDAVLGGQIQHAGDRIRLTVHLIRIADGVQIWNSSIDKKYTDIFAVQDSISEEVAQSIRLDLTPEEKMGLSKRSTRSREAYEAYVKGHFFMDKRTGESLRKGLQYYRDATNIDPAYAQAYAGIADSYALLGLYTGLPPKQAFPQAREAVVKALDLDQGLADAHTTLGFVEFYYDWDGPAAEEEFHRAILSNPSDAIAHSWSAETLAALGRYSEAIREAGLAREADPLSPAVSTNAGFVLYLAGQTDEAIKEFTNAIEIDPNFPRAHYRLGNAYLQKGLSQLAVGEFRRAVELSGGNPDYESGFGRGCALSGNAIEARRTLADLINRSATSYIPPYAIAQLYASLNEKDEAFKWLEKAYQEKSTSMAYLKVDPSLSDLRSDARFPWLAHRIKF